MAYTLKIPITLTEYNELSLLEIDSLTRTQIQLLKEEKRFYDEEQKKIRQKEKNNKLKKKK